MKATRGTNETTNDIFVMSMVSQNNANAIVKHRGANCTAQHESLCIKSESPWTCTALLCIVIQPIRSLLQRKKDYESCLNTALSL